MTEANDQVETDVVETPEVETEEVETEEVETEEVEEKEEVKEEETPEAKKARLARMAKQHEKKHPELYAEKKEVASPTQTGLDTDDIYALMEKKVPKEDIPEIRKYAKMEGISVTEALDSTIVKAILADKAEKRTTAEASNTGGSKRSSGKVTDESLLSNANKGILPESEKDMNRLAKLKLGVE